MKLEKPLIYFDIESSGLDTETARIIELACIKYNVDGTQEEKTILVNPGVSIPKEASDVHGITDEDVKDKPFFRQYASAIRSWFVDCDLAGFNSDNFDIHLLSAEFERSGLEGINWNPNLLDIIKVYRTLYPNTLSEVYKRLTGKELDGAHGAVFDVKATKEIADLLIPKLKETTEEILETVSDIDNFLQGDKKRYDLAGKMYTDVDGVVKWNISKENKDKPVLSNQGFITWFMKGDFPQESKNKIKELQQIKTNHE